jgi:hypothetical protein
MWKRRAYCGLDSCKSTGNRRMIYSLFERVGRNRLFQTLLSKIAAEFSGVSRIFCCLSLDRSKISKDL